MTALPTLAHFSRLGVDFVLSGNRAVSNRRRCELTVDVQRQIAESAEDIANELWARRLIDAALIEARG